MSCHFILVALGYWEAHDIQLGAVWCIVCSILARPASEYNRNFTSVCHGMAGDFSRIFPLSFSFPFIRP
jgi:hypothetical protein